MFKLLIADDEYIEREALKRIILRKFSNIYQIYEADNGIKTVEIAKAQMPELIYMDIKMPGISGLEAAKQIREFLPETNIVFITAYDYFDYAKEAISLNVDELLLKPVEVDTVLSLTEKLTKKIQKVAENKNYTQEMSLKFEQITRRFQQEFMESLNNYNTTGETVEKYLNILDISYRTGYFALLDFKSLDTDQTIGYMQKDFIRTRFLNKLKELSEQNNIVCITGEPFDITQIIFIQTKERDTKYSLLKHIENILIQVIERLNIRPAYFFSKEVSSFFDLPLVLYHFTQTFFYKEKIQTNSYPIDMEEDLITSIGKQDFEMARKIICDVAKIFRSNYDSHTFRREAIGLYAVIRRIFIKFSTDALMPHADELSERIYNDTEMILFFHRLFSYAENSFEKRTDRNKVLIQKVCDYLKSHYNEDISLEDAADYIGFSSFYFAKLMKEYKNMSYIDYLTSLRIQKAKELMVETTKPIHEIALEVGYADANYFTRVFKRIEGFTPSYFRSIQSL
jgi:two-component system, response regulator YesN